MGGPYKDTRIFGSMGSPILCHKSASHLCLPSVVRGILRTTTGRKDPDRSESSKNCPATAKLLTKLVYVQPVAWLVALYLSNPNFTPLPSHGFRV